MEWTTKPVASDSFTLRTGNGVDPLQDATTYTPDQTVSVYLKVHHYHMKYRGLMLEPYSLLLNKSVGKFLNVAEDSGSAFWHPPACPHVLLHTHAELKHFTQRFYWQAPNVTVGDVEFRALIKVGPANEGEFYYPKAFPSLNPLNPLNASANNEGGGAKQGPSSAARKADTWVLGDEAHSCDVVCATKGLMCDEGGLQQKGNYASELDSVALTVDSLCEPTVLSVCSEVSPAQVDGGTCWKRSSCSTPSTCDATADGVRRFCKCAGSANTGAQGASPSAGLVVVVTLLLGLLTGCDVRRSSFVVVVFAMFFCGMPKADAHNWMHSPGRASLEASPVRPCQARRAGQIHQQVGPGQDFVMKFATGHTSCCSYISVVKEEELWRLGKKDITKIFDEYIAEAPAAQTAPATKKAHNPYWMRYHASSRDNGVAKGFEHLYSRELKADDEHWLDHPFSKKPVTASFEYKKDTIKEDELVSYKSEKYPWLESVRKYAHLDSQPSEFDQFRIDIPGHNCDFKESSSCHYVVNWNWRGYYDCVDVSYFPNSVAEINGEKADVGDYLTPLATYVWEKVDHCQYKAPLRVMSQCMLLPEGKGVEGCVELLEETDMFQRFLKGQRPGPSAGIDLFSQRFGINVVPLGNPQHVPFQDEVAIPWDNQLCATGELTHLPGVGDTVSDAVDWKAWAAAGTTTVKQGAKCSSALWPATKMTLREAVSKCLSNDCLGISAEATSLPSGEVHFIGCKKIDTVPNATWTTYLKNIAAVPLDAAPSPVTKVSFQPGKNIIPPVKLVVASVAECNTYTRCGEATGPNARFQIRIEPTTPVRTGYSGTTSNLILKGGGKTMAIGSVVHWAWQGKNFFFYPKMEADADYATTDWTALLNEFKAAFPVGTELSLENSGADFTLPAGFVKDNGEAYGARNGLEYGWVCPSGKPSRLESSKFRTLESDTEWTGVVDVPPPAMDFADCPSESKEKSAKAFWEIKVPNGVYDVKTSATELTNGNKEQNRVAMHIVENRRGPNVRTPMKVTQMHVEVLDGKLSVGAERFGVETSAFENVRSPSRFNANLNTVEIQRVAPRIKKAWHPTTSNPWWQRDLGESILVNNVEVSFATGRTWRNKKDACRLFFLMRGGNTDPCNELTKTDIDYKSPNRNKGPTFTGASPSGYFADGFRVSLSDVPCTSAGCPAGTSCGSMHEPYFCDSFRQDGTVRGQEPAFYDEWCPWVLNCNATGRYVRIELPGAARILDTTFLEVSVTRPAPVRESSPKDLVCYAVEAPVQTPTVPEMEVSFDPEDPVYYSTCWVLNPSFKWLPTTVESPPAPSWKVSDGFCLECDFFKTNTEAHSDLDTVANASNASNTSSPSYSSSPPVWRVSDTCADCDEMREKYIIKHQPFSEMDRASLAQEGEGASWFELRYPSEPGAKPEVGTSNQIAAAVMVPIFVVVVVVLGVIGRDKADGATTSIAGKLPDWLGARFLLGLGVVCLATMLVATAAPNWTTATAYTVGPWDVCLDGGADRSLCQRTNSPEGLGVFGGNEILITLQVLSLLWVVSGLIAVAFTIVASCGDDGERSARFLRSSGHAWLATSLLALSSVFCWAAYHNDVLVVIGETDKSYEPYFGYAFTVLGVGFLVTLVQSVMCHGAAAAAGNMKTSL